MKKIVFSLLLSLPFTSYAQVCVKNTVLTEPMLMPTAKDTLIYEELRHNHSDNKIPAFSYLALPYTRNIADTNLLLSKKKSPVSPSLSNVLNLSPLIVEGTIVNMEDVDTSASAKNQYYTRVYTIQIKSIVKSRYKINVGNKIQVKSNLSGYRRYKNTGAKYYTTRLAEFYEKGKTYLFVLDKYEYMQNMYKIKTGSPSFRGYEDEYCPTAFSMIPATVGLSKEYAEKTFTLDELKKYLSK